VSTGSDAVEKRAETDAVVLAFGQIRRKNGLGIAYQTVTMIYAGIRDENNDQTTNDTRGCVDSLLTDGRWSERSFGQLAGRIYLP